MIPTKNIYWREVGREDDVVVIKSCYVVNDKAVAYWLGSEMCEAQGILEKLVKKTKRRRSG